MSTHDRGAFGQLLAEAKALGCDAIDFYVDFDVPDESDQRWYVTGFRPSSGRRKKRGLQERIADLLAPSACGVGQGRTGEEALRRLVEKLRVARGESQA